jgi:hypothetical protein
MMASKTRMKEGGKVKNMNCGGMVIVDKNYLIGK